MHKAWLTVADPATRDPGIQPIALGPRLRPILLGVGGDASLVDGGADRFTPQLLLGVHGHDGRLLGYFVAETAEGASWGAFHVGPVTAGDVILLARRVRAAFSLVGLRRSVHQAVCLGDAPTPAARERDLNDYLDALGPLTRAGLGRTAFSEDAGELRPVAARSAAAATAVAIVVRTLAARRIDPHRATVAVHAPNALTRDVACDLRRRDVRVQMDVELATPADVLLLGRPRWQLGATEAAAIRAAVLLPLAPTYIGGDAHERLAARGVFAIPEPLVLGGMLTALDFRGRGLGEAAARDRGVAAALSRLDELFDGAPLEQPRRLWRASS